MLTDNGKMKTDHCATGSFADDVEHESNSQEAGRS